MRQLSPCCSDLGSTQPPRGHCDYCADGAAELGYSGRGSRAHSQVPVHCGISILPMSALGQSRPMDTPPPVAACPLCTQNGPVGGPSAKTALSPNPEQFTH